MITLRQDIEALFLPVIFKKSEITSAWQHQLRSLLQKTDPRNVESVIQCLLSIIRKRRVQTPISQGLTVEYILKVAPKHNATLIDPEMLEGNIFFEASSLRDLQLLNIAFLSGVLTHTPYHRGPVHQDTVPLLPKLRMLNAKGFITIDGQKGLVSLGEKVKTATGTLFQDLKQRSYVEGALHVRHLPDLIPFLNAITDRIFYSISKSSTFGDSFVLTANRRYQCVTKNKGKYKIYTNLFPEDNSAWRFLSDCSEGLKKSLSDYVNLCVALKEWGKGSVEDIMLEFFAGEKPAFDPEIFVIVIGHSTANRLCSRRVGGDDQRPSL